jgi:hypothetical protein
MAVGLASNIVGMILTIVACFAISSSNYDIISSTAFSSADVVLADDSAVKVDFQPVELAVGLTAIAINDPNNEQDGEIKSVIGFDQFCNESTIEDLALYFPTEGTCRLAPYPSAS